MYEIMVSYTGVISNASEYVRTGFINQWKRWFLLIILSFLQFITLNIIPLMSGYVIRMYGTRGDTAPEVNEFGRLFIDGWKMNIVVILYLIPAIIVAALGFIGLVPIVAGLISGGRVTEIVGILIGSTTILVGLLIAFLITLIMNMAIVHFSRTGKLFDAFSIGSITRVISEGVGWGQYLVLWIITWIFLLILVLILAGLSLIPVLGWLAGVILAPLWTVFIAKIYANIYDNRP